MIVHVDCRMEHDVTGSMCSERIDRMQVSPFVVSAVEPGRIPAHKQTMLALRKRN